MSLGKFFRRFDVTCHLHLQGLKVLEALGCQHLKMMAIHTGETSGTTYKKKQCHISEDLTLQVHLYENLSTHL